MNDHWLPDLMLISDFKVGWNEYLEALHTAFEKDFVNSKPKWPNKRVGLKRHPVHEGKSATFWHMISAGAREEERLPNIRRCERIRWPRAMMDEYDALPPGQTNARIVWWKEIRSTETRIVLSLEDFSYLTVVADRGEYVLPWTAYPVERSHQQQKQKGKFEAFWGDG